MSRNKGKPVWGVGINDSDYPTRIVHEENGRQVTDWMCPFYMKWRDMLERCYSKKFHDKKPTYIGSKACDEWLTFSNFKSWMEKQDWKGMHLDKDLLEIGNHTYSPEMCLFISPIVNTFFTERTNDRGNFMIGTHRYRDGRFVAQCSNPFNPKNRFIGYFNTDEEAHEAWRVRKNIIAGELCERDISLSDIAKEALKSRYSESNKKYWRNA